MILMAHILQTAWCIQFKNRIGGVPHPKEITQKNLFASVKGELSKSCMKTASLYSCKIHTLVLQISKGGFNWNFQDPKWILLWSRSQYIFTLLAAKTSSEVINISSLKTALCSFSGTFFFTDRVVTYWNSLPTSFVSSPLAALFKKHHFWVQSRYGHIQRPAP